MLKRSFIKGTNHEDMKYREIIYFTFLQYIRFWNFEKWHISISFYLKTLNLKKLHKTNFSAILHLKFDDVIKNNDVIVFLQSVYYEYAGLLLSIGYIIHQKILNVVNFDPSPDYLVLKKSDLNSVNIIHEGKELQTLDVDVIFTWDKIACFWNHFRDVPLAWWDFKFIFSIFWLLFSGSGSSNLALSTTN